jgi:hypothetical protein
MFEQAVILLYGREVQRSKLGEALTILTVTFRGFTQYIMPEQCLEISYDRYLSNPFQIIIQESFDVALFELLKLSLNKA